jgi:hypothetical protein
MRRLDGAPLDPVIATSLEAIDATLAGDPVDPAHAELAELALLLAADRPQPTSIFVSALDERVRQRFVVPKAQTARERKRFRPRAERNRTHRWWIWTPAAGFASALLAAIVIVLGHGTGGTPSAGSGGNAASAEAQPHAAASVPAKRAAPQPLSALPRRSAAPPSALPGRTSSASAFVPNDTNSAASGALSQGLQPPPNGRKIIQGAQLSLIAKSNRIDDVAQEVFVVVGQVHGIVNSSQVTATGGPGGYAQFQLSIPSGSMPQAMADLSTVRYARVSSRTDTTRDVNNQYNFDVHKLADDRARRSALLAQLAKAVTQGQIDSLTAKIHDTEAEISSDQATLGGLNHQIAYSQVALTINGGGLPVLVHSSGGGGFSLHKAVHDAGRVLTVAAGVALIGLAALTPIGLLAALAWWIASAIRRRRREQALDLV